MKIDLCNWNVYIGFNHGDNIKIPQMYISRLELWCIISLEGWGDGIYSSNSIAKSSKALVE